MAVLPSRARIRLAAESLGPPATVADLVTDAGGALEVLLLDGLLKLLAEGPFDAVSASNVALEFLELDEHGVLIGGLLVVLPAAGFFHAIQARPNRFYGLFGLVPEDA